MLRGKGAENYLSEVKLDQLNIKEGSTTSAFYSVDSAVVLHMYQHHQQQALDFTSVAQEVKRAADKKDREAKTQSAQAYLGSVKVSPVLVLNNVCE